VPLTKKGQEILKRLKAEYGDKKGTSVFYAGINKGRFTGVEIKKSK
jgi:hypothetical protein